MKFCRVFSVFFLCVFLTTLSLSPVAAASEILDGMDVAAKAALLIDPDTEEILYEENIHDRLYPASLTKIMTALLVLEEVEAGNLTMDQPITASANAIESVPDGSSTAGLEVGETLSLENLLYCLMVVSGNEAANILAETVSGSVESFVTRMNSKAQALGCEDTHFVNPNGLHDEDHYTSAWDLYLITKAAMEYEDFMTFADAPYFTLPATEFHSERTLYTTNLLLSPYRGAGYVYPDAAGVKTGSTTPAGNCLVSTASRDGRSLLGVILGAERVELEDGSTQVQSFSEMARMFDWGFDQFSRQVIISADELIAEREVSLSEITHVVVHPAYEVERLLPNDVAPEDLERTYTYTADVVEAPVTKGDVLGEVTISYEDQVYATVPLLARDDVAASRLLVFRRDVMDFVSRTEVRIGAVVLVVLILVVLILIKTSGRRRRRYGRGGGYSSRSSNYRGRRRRR